MSAFDDVVNETCQWCESLIAGEHDTECVWPALKEKARGE